MFHEMRYLTKSLASPSHDLQSPNDMRPAIEARLLALGHQINQNKFSKTQLDYLLEERRLGALIYIKTLLLPKQDIVATNPALRALEAAVLAHLRESLLIGAFSMGVHSNPYTYNMLWALWMGAILAADGIEEESFSGPIALGCNQAGISTWEEMESRLREICWRTELRTGACMKVWERVKQINRGVSLGLPGRATECYGNGELVCA